MVVASDEAPAMADSANLVGVHPRAGPADQHVLALPPAYDLAQARMFVCSFVRSCTYAKLSAKEILAKGCSNACFWGGWQSVCLEKKISPVFGRMGWDGGGDGGVLVCCLP